MVLEVYLCHYWIDFCRFGLWSTLLSQSTFSGILLYGASFIAKRGLSLDTPLKPWTWMSASLIGCKAPTDNTCFTPSSKLTPGALRNIGSISSSSCIQSHSCPIRHQGAAALITDPRWTLTHILTHTYTLEHCRIFAGNWSALSETQCWSSWPWRCWFCRCWSEYWDRIILISTRASRRSLWARKDASLCRIQVRDKCHW